MVTSGILEVPELREVAQKAVPSVGTHERGHVEARGLGESALPRIQPTCLIKGLEPLLDSPRHHSGTPVRKVRYFVIAMRFCQSFTKCKTFDIWLQKPEPLVGGSQLAPQPNPTSHVNGTKVRWSPEKLRSIRLSRLPWKNLDVELFAKPF